MVSVLAPSPGRISSSAMALAVVLPVLGVLIIVGVFLIWKQRRSKGNQVVRESWLARSGAGFSRTWPGRSRRGHESSMGWRPCKMAERELGEPCLGTPSAERVRETAENSWAEL